jgi:hypothetical protein
LLDVTDAGAKFFGGDSRFTYSIQPLGSKEPATARFETSFDNADLASFADFQNLPGLRFAGSATGENVSLEWPLGRFAERRGGAGDRRPPPGVQPVVASLGPARAATSITRVTSGDRSPRPLPRHLRSPPNCYFASTEQV